MAWIRACASAENKFPFNLLDQTWDIMPTTAKTITTGDTFWYMLVKTPRLTGNNLSVQLNRSVSGNTRVEVSNDNGTTWDVIIDLGSGDPVGTQTVTKSLANYTGNDLMVRVAIAGYGATYTLAPVGSFMQII